MSHYLQFDRCPKDYLYKDSYLIFTIDIKTATDWVKKFLKKNNFRIVDNDVVYDAPHLQNKETKI